MPTLLLCCGGTTVGIPITWLLNETGAASRGAPTPDSAANEYLMAFGYNEEAGLLAVLDNGDQEALLKQWRAYRAAMDGTTPPASRFDFGALAVSPIEDSERTSQ